MLCLAKNLVKQANASSKRYRGRAEYLAYQEGKRLSASAAVKAYCYTCMSGYADGSGDCGDSKCPLHPFMPYNEKKEKRRVLKPEQIEKLKAGAKK